MSARRLSACHAYSFLTHLAWRARLKYPNRLSVEHPSIVSDLLPPLPPPPPLHLLPWCRALQARPPQDYEPWAAALPYVYKLRRLLPCYKGAPPAARGGAGVDG